MVTLVDVFHLFTSVANSCGLDVCVSLGESCLALMLLRLIIIYNHCLNLGNLELFRTSLGAIIFACSEADWQM